MNLIYSLPRFQTSGHVRRLTCMYCRCMSTADETARKQGLKFVYFFNDKEKAGEIAQLILKNRKYKKSLFIESYPGEGVLTKALLKKNGAIKKYVCFEQRKQYLDSLQDYQKEIGENRLQIEYINNRKHTVYDNIEEEVIMSAIENEGISSVTFIGMVHDNYVPLTIYDMLRKLKDTEGILQTITPEYFYFASPNTHRKMENLRKADKNSNLFKALPIMMDYFFDIKFIAEIPFTSFHPVISKGRRSFMELRSDNEIIKGDKEYLMHMIPRQDHIRDINDFNQLKFFLTQVLMSPKERIIPKMESWIPDSGIQLIRMGITMIDRFIDSNSHQLVQIYKDMKEWPGYELSYFYWMFSQLDKDGIHEGQTHSLIPREENENKELVEWKDDDHDLFAVDDKDQIEPVP